MSVVICKLPKAGLGNQLFPLMKAYLFAHINHLPLMVINYHQLKPGPWLRREKNKRIYNGFFIFEKNIPNEILDKWKVYRLLKKRVIEEPEIMEMPEDEIAGKIFLFNKIPHYSRRFEGLKEQRELVIKLLHHIILPSNKSKIDQKSSPCIGVHIRMGDFRKLRKGEEFGTVGTVRTPQSYFINTINSIRNLNGSYLPVCIFTDGTKSELVQLFDLPNIHLIENNNDLVDLILLSKSKIIVTSAGSTFSYWAGFISNAPIIIHPTTLHHRVRTLDNNNELYEGVLDENNPDLIKTIKGICL